MTATQTESTPKAAKEASIKAVADYFRLPGQGLTAFTAEWKALPETDKADLRRGLGDGTLNY